MDLAKLRDQLATYFNLRELYTLCFDLSIERENIPGDTLEGITRELISYCHRRGRLSELIEYCRKQRPRVDWPRYEENLFSREVIDFQKQNIRVIVQHLYEWKIIHSRVQNLLFSTELVLEALDRFLNDKTEANANEIERQWLRFCQPKAEKIVKSFVGLALVNHSLIEELLSLLQGESSVVVTIRYLKIDDNQSINHICSTTYALVDTLKEILIMADVNIVQIAESLMST